MKKILLKLCSNYYYTYRTLYKLKIFKLIISYLKWRKAHLTMSQYIMKKILLKVLFYTIIILSLL